MKTIIHNFCEGFYDNLPLDKKKEIDFNYLETIMMKVGMTLFKKLIYVFILMIVSIYAMFVFSIPNKVSLSVLEFLLWCIWIKETIDWKEFKELMKVLNKR
ncbi:MAG: hypothetical protein HUJ53_08975 [Holdemanella sp.]|nr:hypothetical protein [Holdemanella sp.]